MVGGGILRTILDRVYHLWIKTHFCSSFRGSFGSFKYFGVVYHFIDGLEDQSQPLETNTGADNFNATDRINGNEDFKEDTIMNHISALKISEDESREAIFNIRNDENRSNLIFIF